MVKVLTTCLLKARYSVMIPCGGFSIVELIVEVDDGFVEMQTS